MKNFYLKLLTGSVLGLTLLFLGSLNAVQAAQTFTANEVTPNATLGTANQTDAFATSTANAVEVKASRTIVIDTLPVDADAFTLGTCVVTFATSTADDTNCSGGATVRTNLGTNLAARSIAQLATVLQSLNATSTTHGALSATASSTNTSAVVFTTTGAETSATTINFTDATVGTKLSSPAYANITGVVAAAQILTITIDGTVDTGDTFSVTTASLNSGSAVTYTVLSSDTTTTLIATGLNAAIQAATGYGTTLTSSASTNTVLLTAATPGTGFNIITSTTNRSAAAQVVTFTPGTIEPVTRDTFKLTLNGVVYTTSNGNVKSVVESLVDSLAADTSVSCTEDDAAITCTAVTPGTAFTYDTEVTTRSSSGGSSSSHGGGGGNNSKPAPKPVVPAVVATTPASTNSSVSFSYTRTLGVGSTGEDVRALQLRLTAEGVYTGPVTGYYGVLTTAGVRAFQSKYGIPSVGLVGPMTKAFLNK